MSLEQDICDLLNKHSRENKSHTPDFILAKYMMNCLEAYEFAIEQKFKQLVDERADRILNHKKGGE